MTTLTLENIKAEHDRLGSLIAKLEAAAKAPYLFAIPEALLELHPGERYAGLVLGDDGMPSHHLILLPDQPSERLDWKAAKAWAASVGGELPNRREQSLLFANLKDQFESAYYWSSEQHAENGAYAWFQYFTFGNQSYGLTSCEARVRAVRRLTA